MPGHFCGCVGIKPTVGRFSTTGVVQACRALDCVSVFARSVEDGAEVARLMQVRCWPKTSSIPSAMHGTVQAVNVLQVALRASRDLSGSHLFMTRTA